MLNRKEGGPLPIFSPSALWNDFSPPPPPPILASSRKIVAALPLRRFYSSNWPILRGDTSRAVFIHVPDAVASACRHFVTVTHTDTLECAESISRSLVSRRCGGGFGTARFYGFQANRLRGTSELSLQLVAIMIHDIYLARCSDITRQQHSSALKERGPSAYYLFPEIKRRRRVSRATLYQSYSDVKWYKIGDIKISG